MEMHCRVNSLANLNCEIEDMIWLQSILLLNYYINYQHASNYHKIPTFSNIILQFDISNVSKKSKINAENTFSDSFYLENMYHNSFYDKRFLGYG